MERKNVEHQLCVMRSDSNDAKCFSESVFHVDHMIANFTLVPPTQHFILNTENQNEALELVLD